MCGRASLAKAEKELEERFQATFYSEELESYPVLPNYNIAPTQMHPVITGDDPDHLQFFRWGLIPFWAKDKSIGSKMINARIESILEKSAFREGIHKRRCIIPFDGFYEWKKAAGGKIPYRITLKDEGLFSVAGIWEKWADKDGSPVYSFTVITQEPNELMAPIHNRMPAILKPEQEINWLDQNTPTEEALALISPYPDELLHAYTVSRRVNKVSENHQDLFKPVSYDEGGVQGSLF